MRASLAARLPRRAAVQALHHGCLGEYSHESMILRPFCLVIDSEANRNRLSTEHTVGRVTRVHIALTTRRAARG
jgi:hypothetical protein